MHTRRMLAAATAVALLVLAPPGAQAQQTGTVTGEVTDASTGQPLAGAQIFVPNTNLGTLTNREGRYLLQNVPSGQQQVSVVLLGYGPIQRSVTVPAGGTAELDFAMTQSAIALDQVVVTAVGEQRKRELGNAVATIQAEELTEVAPITNMATLLTGRSAGVQIFGSSGTPGMGSRIRIRGANSLSLSNEPLVYVDGIRVTTSTGMGGGYTGGQEPSRLDDLNPEDIESVEVVRGPAAATLYGTEAANGVIRITTKRGRAGSPQWNVWLEGGIVTDPNTYPENYAGLDADGGGFAEFCLLVYEQAGLCAQDEASHYQILHDDEFSPLQTGARRQYGLSVRGGTDLVTYYVSGEFEKEVGPYTLPDRDRQDLEERGIPIDEDVEHPQNYNRASLRVNLNANVAQNMTLGLRSGFISSRLSFTGNDNNSFGFLPSGFFGGAIESEGWDGGWGFQRPAQLFGRDLLQDVERFTSALNHTWRPTTWLTTRATAGLDYTNQKDISFIPRDLGVPGSSNLGSKVADFRDIFRYTMDAVATANFDVTDAIASRTSVGFQYFEDKIHGTFADGTDLPPGAGSISAAAETSSGEFHVQNKQAGVFIEEQIGLNDRLFLTAALRGDDASAFGKDFEAIIYPKASLSWLITEEPFFPRLGLVDQLRLRVAWGQSGLQPGSDDALRTLQANPITDPTDNTVVGVRLDELGNATLEPEQTSEIEAGFDVDIMEGRLGLELTYYSKKSEAALVSRPLPPSLGADPSRWVNVGQVNNSGIELALSATPVRTEPVQWTINVSGSNNANELVELAEGQDEIGTLSRHKVGYPLGGWWEQPIESWSDADGDGVISTDELVIGDTSVFVGPSMPEREISISTNLTLFERVGIYAQLDHRGDYYAYNNTERFRCRFRLCRALVDRTTPLDDQARAVAAIYHGSQTVHGYIEKADFWKLRELSVSYTLPEEWAAKIRATRATLVVTGRNLGTWTDYTGMDPEINWAGASDNFGISEFLTQPPIRYWTIRVNLGF